MMAQPHLLGLQTRHSSTQRLDGKKALLQALYDSNLPEPLFFDLYVFLDWVLTLPDSLETQFEHFVATCEETNKMPYVTHIERRGIQQGHRQGHQQGLEQGLLQKSRENIIDVLKVRFHQVPNTLIDEINALSDTLRLSTLLKEAATSHSLAEFTRRFQPPVFNAPGRQLITSRPRRRRS